MWIANALAFNWMTVCPVLPALLSPISKLTKKKMCVKTMISDVINFLFFFICVFLEKKKSEWNESLICWVVSPEDEKAKCVSALSLDQTASGDVGWDERLWEMGRANAAIYPSPPYIYLSPSSALVILLSHTDTHKYFLSPCVSLSHSNLEHSHWTFISSLVLLTQSFQTQWGGIS